MSSKSSLAFSFNNETPLCSCISINQCLFRVLLFIPLFAMGDWSPNLRNQCSSCRICGVADGTKTGFYTCNSDFSLPVYLCCRSQWPRGLRRRSSAARLLRLWVRIPPGAWIFVCCECCVLSGRDLCDELITRPGESYRRWRVVVCDQETSKTRRLKPATGL